MSLAPDGTPLWPPREPMRRDCFAMSCQTAIRSVVEFFHEYGGVPSVCAVPWAIFEELLAERAYNGPVAFPAPGLFVQTGRGWVYIVADPRLNSGRRGWLRDAYTGDSVKVDF